MMYDGGHGFGGGFMWIFWIALIVIVIWAVNNFGGNKTNQIESKGDALEILKARYAKGEITKEAFEEMKKNIV